MKTVAAIGASLLAIIGAQAQNLIVNGAFEAGNTGFTNSYLYEPVDLWIQGKYAVTSDPRIVHYLWASFGDHSTGKGLMLVVNGDSNPTNVVWQQTVDVSTNTDYLISGWVASSHPVSPGSVVLRVNGVQQGPSVDISSTPGTWRNFSAIWNSGNAVSAVIEIRSLNTQTIGNDFVIDDLSCRSLDLSVPAPSPSIQTAVAISWPSTLDQLYQVQWASELNSNQWFNLWPLAVGNGTTNSAYDLLGQIPKRFYRVLPVN